MKKGKFHIIFLIGLVALFSGCVDGGIGPRPAEGFVPIPPEVVSPPQPTPVSILEDLGPAKQVEALVIDGHYFPKSQFRISNNPDDVCKAPHYHAEIATSVCGSTKPDPAPESCGYGKVSEVPVKKLTQGEIEKICSDSMPSIPLPDFSIPEFSIGCKGGEAGGEKNKLSEEDLKKYDKAHKEVKPLNQPQSTTCSPTSGAMDLLYWNETLYPGLVTVDPESLIKDLAKRMETSGTKGTNDDKMVIGLADYLAEHAKGKFTVKYVFRYKEDRDPSNINVKGTKATFVATTTMTIDDIGAEMDKKANVLLTFMIEAAEGNIRHVVKLAALDTKGAAGKYKVAFADPGNGKIMEAEMDYDGNMEIKGESWKLRGIVSVTPVP